MNITVEHAIRLRRLPFAGDEFLDMARYDVLGLVVDHGAIGTRKLDKPGSRNVLSQVASECYRDKSIADAMKDERRNVNRRQNVADINLVVGFYQSTNGPGDLRRPAPAGQPPDYRFVGEMSVLMNAHPLIGPALAQLFMQVMFAPVSVVSNW